MVFTSILAVTDFSADGDRAVERAAQLAVSHGATLRLLYAPLSPDPVCADPVARMAHSAAAVSRRFALQVHDGPGAAASLEHIATLAAGADLLVINHFRERSIQALLCGQPAVRLVRLCNRPVLVVQQAARVPFRRILVAVDLAAQSQQLAMLACAVARNAQVELFHALDTVGESRLLRADVSREVVRSYRQGRVQHAQQRMAALAQSLDAHSTKVLSAIGHGDHARQAAVRQAHVGADLLVVGKRRSSAVADFFLGSTARQVLALATCDVLVVPQGVPPSTRAAATRRMGAGAGLRA